MGFAFGAVIVVSVVAGWVAVDAARRRRLWFLWAALVAGSGLLALPVWIAVRRRSPASIDLGAPRALIVFLSPFLTLALLASAMAALAAMLIFRVAHVEGQAMAPAINHQDRLLVNRLAFRDRPPRRLDIVMMLYPRNPERKFVMRIIGEPGDRLEIKGGWVYLNGEPYDDTFVAPESRSRDDWGPRVVPQGHYFVLGDRRNNSSDSRHWGFVPRSHILGRVHVRWFPQARRF